MRWLVTLSALALVACLAGRAEADAIMAPSLACPPGARGDSDHYGEYCEAWTCASDADCSGLRCLPLALCVEEHTFGSPRGNTYRMSVLGACGEGHACLGGGACRTGTYCAPQAAPPPPAPPPPAPPPTTSAAPPAAPPTSCSASGAAGALPWLCLLAACPWLVRRRAL
jgi:hypothetical protein